MSILEEENELDKIKDGELIYGDCIIKFLNRTRPCTCYMPEAIIGRLQAWKCDKKWPKLDKWNKILANKPFTREYGRFMSNISEIEITHVRIIARTGFIVPTAMWNISQDYTSRMKLKKEYKEVFDD
tara:strand:- start:39 stop:419 length:381 start_codon:yes stop_codon:yes gene_type:complete